jgi:hypothetical protein
METCHHGSCILHGPNMNKKPRNCSTWTRCENSKMKKTLLPLLDNTTNINHIDNYIQINENTDDNINDQQSIQDNNNEILHQQNQTDQTIQLNEQERYTWLLRTNKNIWNENIIFVPLNNNDNIGLYFIRYLEKYIPKTNNSTNRHQTVEKNIDLQEETLHSNRYICIELKNIQFKDR